MFTMGNAIDISSEKGEKFNGFIDITMVIFCFTVTETEAFLI